MEGLILRPGLLTLPTACLVISRLQEPCDVHHSSQASASSRDA
ncbi:MAG: hypothetical protein JCHSAcid_15500 [uncultured Acidilobus sp. JCHS]|nr:MAG: hypothetical protein JCHSAcid_15500 [uncultured Acidilobus sp. JCHS]